MSPRTSLLSTRKALSIVLRQPSVSPAQTSNNTLNATRLSSNPGVSIGLVPSGKTQRRFNSSKPDSKDRSDQKEAERHPTAEKGAELEEGIRRSEGIAGTPEEVHGSPISEVLKRDEKAKEFAPKVMQDQMNKGPNGTRSFSTSARLRQGEPESSQGAQQNPDDASVAMIADMISQATEEKAEALELPGLKFRAPELPLPKTENFRSRYDALLEQFTKLLMIDGKLSRAQKHMSFILDHLRTAPPPQINPKRRLLPAPPAPQLPLNPVLYLALVVDSVAPLIKIRQQKGIIGGGAAVQIPIPLSERQRRRMAIRWIIDASDRRRDTYFGQRVANELVAVAEGRSNVWDRREHVHKIGVAGRSNLGSFAR